MSWMDFKTAQAMKAQKIASDARKQKNGDIQKAAGESKPQITTQSIGVKTAMGAPKATRRVQGVSKNARMTFAPGAMQPTQKADTRACDNNPNVQLNAAPQSRPSGNYSAKSNVSSYSAEKDYSYPETQSQINNTAVSSGFNQSYDQGSYEQSYDEGYDGNQGDYDQNYDQGGYDDQGGYYEEGYDEGGYEEYDEGY